MSAHYDIATIGTPVTIASVVELHVLLNSTFYGNLILFFFTQEDHVVSSQNFTHEYNTRACSSHLLCKFDFVFFSYKKTTSFLLETLHMSKTLEHVRHTELFGILFCYF